MEREKNEKERTAENEGKILKTAVKRFGILKLVLDSCM